MVVALRSITCSRWSDVVFAHLHQRPSGRHWPNEGLRLDPPSQLSLGLRTGQALTAAALALESDGALYLCVADSPLAVPHLAPSVP